MNKFNTLFGLTVTSIYYFSFVKIVFRNTVSIFLAIVVLFSTFSFAINENYCLDNLVGISIFSKTTTSDVEMKPSSDMKGFYFQERDCTSSVVKMIEGQNNLKTDSLSFEFELPTFTTLYLYSYINLFEGSGYDFVPFNDYSPPPLVKDIRVLDEVFLI